MRGWRKYIKKMGLVDGSLRAQVMSSRVRNMVERKIMKATRKRKVEK